VGRPSSDPSPSFGEVWWTNRRVAFAGLLKESGEARRRLSLAKEARVVLGLDQRVEDDDAQAGAFDDEYVLLVDALEAVLRFAEDAEGFPRWSWCRRRGDGHLSEAAGGRHGQLS